MSVGLARGTCTHQLWRCDLMAACVTRRPSLSCPLARRVRAVWGVTLRFGWLPGSNMVARFGRVWSSMSGKRSWAACGVPTEDSACDQRRRVVASDPDVVEMGDWTVMLRWLTAIRSSTGIVGTVPPASSRDSAGCVIPARAVTSLWDSPRARRRSRTAWPMRKARLASSYPSRYPAVPRSG